MNKKQILPILAGVFLALMVGAYGLYTWLGQSIQPDTAVPQKSMYSTEKTDSWTPKIPAPDFTVYDGDNNTVNLSDYMGKPIVLNFWASWCGPCQMEMPHFESVYQEMGEDIHFIMVNMTGGRETLNSAKSFLNKTGYTFPVFFDLDLDAAYAYNAFSLPTTVFIDADGNIRDMVSGAISEATLRGKIDKIL